jgi:hypothetical protein
MDLRTNHAVVTAAEPIASQMQEQGVELDYVLPDYYPDVCKLVKCFVTPVIVSESISGDRLSYELRAEVRILYCSENSHVLQCVTQTLHFSRTAELPAGENLTADLTAVTDYVNCRAVSRRRLDVRGAVSVRIRICTARQQEVLSDVFEKSIQLRKIPVQYPARRFHTDKTLVLAEELELSSAKPPVLHIVRCDAKPSEESHKLVSGKLMVQGSLAVQLLYACEKDGEALLEPMSFRIPYSQLVELDGMEEQDFCRVQCRVISCDLKPVADAGGDVRLLRCEAELRLSCTALRTVTEALVCDAFSTEHPCTVQSETLTVGGAPTPFTEMQAYSTKLSCTDGTLGCVCDAWCEVRNLTARVQTDTSEVLISGMLCCNVLVQDQDGMPELLEKEEPFEHRFAAGELGNSDVVEVEATAENCTYTLSAKGEISLKAELRMEGNIRHYRDFRILTEVQLEAAVHPKDCALKLYFGRAQEQIWEIAKRCHTSVEAIMEENELTGEALTENGMLLIPITGGNGCRTDTAAPTGTEAFHFAG